MGAIFITIEVADVPGERLEQVEVMVDTGATFTTLPAEMLRRLGFSPQRVVPARLADGTIVEDEICDAQTHLEGQTFFTPWVFDQENEPSLLGVVALEAALLAVDPAAQRLVPTIAWKA